MKYTKTLFVNTDGCAVRTSGRRLLRLRRRPRLRWLASFALSAKIHFFFFVHVKFLTGLIRIRSALKRLEFRVFSDFLLTFSRIKLHTWARSEQRRVTRSLCAQFGRRTYVRSERRRTTFKRVSIRS